MSLKYKIVLTREFEITVLEEDQTSCSASCEHVRMFMGEGTCALFEKKLIKMKRCKECMRDERVNLPEVDLDQCDGKEHDCFLLGKPNCSLRKQLKEISACAEKTKIELTKDRDYYKNELERVYRQQLEQLKLCLKR